MIKIRPEQINMSQTDFENMHKNLDNFYNSNLYDSKKFSIFLEKLNIAVSKCVGKSKEEKLNEINKVIFPYMYTGSKNCRETTSKLIAVAYIDNDVIFHEAFQGGKNNFSEYIKCLVASRYTKNNTERLLLENEIYAIKRSMSEMRYYRNNPPDREM